VRIRDGEVTIRPIAGTRPRGATRQEDRANEESLLADPKERAEHLMLLDLGRNDVGRVAAAGTVKVTESYTIERYSHVMHIVSNVVGKLDTARADGGRPARRLPGRHRQRRAQGARLRDHRRTGTRNARRLCRRRRLFRARRLGR
jgi:isochorismate synthase EntC